MHGKKGRQMDELSSIKRQACLLARDALSNTCRAFGIEVAPIDAWGSRDERRVPIGDADSPESRRVGKLWCTLTIGHDEREAPIAINAEDVLISLTDEGEVALCAWALPAATSRIAGIGLDLASVEDFAGERGATFNRLLFSPHEQEFVSEWYASRPEAGFAFAFAAKEASFKALAAPLRTWYGTHEEELTFEVREFELADATHERGTLRHACAQRAMDALGIMSIELHHRVLDDAVLVLAIALT